MVGVEKERRNVYEQWQNGVKSDKVSARQVDRLTMLHKVIHVLPIIAHEARVSAGRLTLVRSHQTAGLTVRPTAS